MTIFTLANLSKIYVNSIRVSKTIFFQFGGKSCFGGKIVTVKYFADNAKVNQLIARACCY